MKKIFIFLALTTFLISCDKENNQSSATQKENSTNVTQNQPTTKETLVTSIPPLKWLTQKIAGEDYVVISIIQPNMNHELFEPKPNDLVQLEKSKLFFTYNALNFEEKITNSVNDNKKIANLLENVDKSLLLENHHDHDHEHDEHKHKDHKEDEHKEEHKHEHNEKFDPHVWFSLDLMPKVAENIKNKLTETYPEKKEIFEKNYTALLEEIEAFKKEISEEIAKKTNKSYMIYHPTLNYFLKNYPLEEIAVEYDGKEPSAKQIQEIIEEAKEHKITTIFVQPQFPKQSIEVISKEIPNSKIVEFNADEENVFENLRKFVNNLN